MDFYSYLLSSPLPAKFNAPGVIKSTVWLSTEVKEKLTTIYRVCQYFGIK